MSGPRILVVDDEPVVIEVVERYLTREGYDVATASDGRLAMAALRAHHPHLVVLDLMLPHVSGMEICREIRREGTTPVIMLTARGDEMDRIAGFEIGADDYLAKPFSPRELVARVKAVLKRSFDPSQLEQGTRRFGDVAVNAATRTVSRAGEELHLTAREFDLLWFFATNPGRAFSREQLLERVWGLEAPGDASTVTVHVRRLRTKIEPDPDRPAYLATIWGVGYRWDG